MRRRRAHLSIARHIDAQVSMLTISIALDCPALRLAHRGAPADLFNFLEKFG